HGRRGVGRLGARPRASERHGDRGGEGQDARGSGQCSAVSARPAVPRAAAAHQPRAAVRARPRPRARATHRRGAQAAQGRRRLISGVVLVAKPGARGEPGGAGAGVAGPTPTEAATRGRRAASDGWRSLDRVRVEAAVSRFRGAYEQRPPAYSAVKVEGERAYRRARRGEAVTLPARRVEVGEFALT